MVIEYSCWSKAISSHWEDPSAQLPKNAQPGGGGGLQNRAGGWLSTKGINYKLSFSTFIQSIFRDFGRRGLRVRLDQFLNARKNAEAITALTMCLGASSPNLVLNLIKQELQDQGKTSISRMPFLRRSNPWK